MIMPTEHCEFTLDMPADKARSRCLDAVNTLGWRIRRDLSQEYQITCFVPIAELLPQAPVYTIALWPQNQSTTIVLAAANDDLSQSHGQSDLPRLKTAILGDSAAAPLSDSQHQATCFISYRRYDSADVVGRIYDRLVETFGSNKIFKDVNNIPIGVDFRKVLQQALSNCTVLLAVIG